MSIATLWKIVIKLIGIWLLIECVYSIPQFIISLYTILYTGEELTSMLVISIGVLSIFILLIKLCLFKTDQVVNMLHLEKHFDNEKINLPIITEKLLRMAVIVIGGYLIAVHVPSFFRSVILYMQKDRLAGDYVAKWSMAYDLVVSLIGYLLMTNSRRVARFIDSESARQ